MDAATAQEVAIAPNEHRGRGRPPGSTFDKPLVQERICLLISEGSSLRKICAGEVEPRDHTLPAITMPDMSVVLRWLREAADEEAENPGAAANFGRQYDRAREVQADCMVDDCLTIADDGRNDTYVDENGKTRVDHDCVSRSKLRVDTRKWIASRLLPRKYGERGVGLTINQTQNVVVMSEDERIQLIARRQMIQQGARPDLLTGKIPGPQLTELPNESLVPVQSVADQVAVERAKFVEAEVIEEPEGEGA